MAIVGGTNIGKSAIFNHLAGEMASAVSPLAAGTRHPVCLVPEDFDDETALSRLFTGFELQRWHAAEDPLAETPEHRLFWQARDATAACCCWIRPTSIPTRRSTGNGGHHRQASDVLIAVLTQQKYNDAAVKQFFRKAAEADKPIIVLFNQVDLVADREYWPLWLDTFAEETGTGPSWSTSFPMIVGRPRRSSCRFIPSVRRDANYRSRPARCATISRRLHFDKIKIRTFRGAARSPARSGHRRPGLLGAAFAMGRRIRGGVAGTGRGRNGPRPLARRAAAIARGRNPRLVGRPS